MRLGWGSAGRMTLWREGVQVGWEGRFESFGNRRDRSIGSLVTW